MERKHIRNFCIISHIDHGKSTLADRFLELTKTIPQEKMRPQFLDLMELERERGITIKMQPVRMVYNLNLKFYILNLIDTPGHVDFSYEVSRALAAVEGALLLVDAAQGIQAQTIANLELAQKQNLVIIPVVNKIDLPNAQIEQTTQELANLLGVKEKEVIKISAKFDINVDKVLKAVIDKIPSPSEPQKENVDIGCQQGFQRGELISPLRALIFDSKYDLYKGVIAYVRLINGRIKTGQKFRLINTKIEGQAKEVGYFEPLPTPQKELLAGDIGYIATGIKKLDKVRVGETITLQENQAEVLPLPGYKEPQAVVFTTIYPENPDHFDLLKDSFEKLQLTDASFTFEPERKGALGRGFGCGFLGTLHAEIIIERLKREFGLNLVISSPSVVFKIITSENKEVFIYSSSDWPEQSKIKEAQEQWVKLEIVCPVAYLGKVMEVLKELRGEYVETKYFTSQRVIIIYEVPLREIITGFYDRLKNVSQGYASMGYKLLAFRAGDLVKLEVLIAGQKQEAFSKIVPKDKAYQEGRALVKKLKEALPPQLFSVALQAVVGAKIIARETIRARGKDVIAPLYGGDYTRKRKLLEKQKKGKKKLKERGEVKIPPKVFLEVFKG